MADLDLDRIQGNIVPGFNKDHQAFVFVRFQGADQGRRWLTDLQPHLASAREVQQFKALFTSVRRRAPHPTEPDSGALDHLRSTWVNLALSFGGVRLVAPYFAPSSPSGAFRRGSVPGLTAAADAHAVVIIAADTVADVDAELEHHRELLAAVGVQELHTLRGDTLPGAARGHEHFGFKDGISQPRVAGTDFGDGPEVAAGEFVLGYADQANHVSGAESAAWMRNGSFLAFVQLRQHVATFWSAMKQQAKQQGVCPVTLASSVVGRSREGDLVSDPPGRLSHVGRAYARWLGPAEAPRHRLIRRGIPYGPAWSEGEPDGGHDRGLLFVSYQADLERQFEHVWTQWLGATTFPIPGAGTDGLVGQSGSLQPGPTANWSPTATRRVAATRPGPTGGAVSLSFPSFVTPVYGGYFFSPGIGIPFPT